MGFGPKFKINDKFGMSRKSEKIPTVLVENLRINIYNVMYISTTATPGEQRSKTGCMQTINIVLGRLHYVL